MVSIIVLLWLFVSRSQVGILMRGIQSHVTDTSGMLRTTSRFDGRVTRSWRQRFLRRTSLPLPAIETRSGGRSRHRGD